MKLHDYNQMMSYMRRPGFQDGTVPLKKPESSFINKLQTLKEMKGGLMPRSKVAILKMYMDEALKDGEITQEQHTEMLMPYFGELGENVTEQIKVSDRDNFAIGGGVIEGEDLGTREGFAEIKFNPNRLLSEMSDLEKYDYFQDLTKKQKIAAGLEKKRVSTKIDVYTDALNEYDKLVKRAFNLNDASKLPKPFAQFLNDKGLKSGTYFSLKNFDILPNIKTDVANLRLDLANKLIDESNNQLKFIEKEALLKKANFTSDQINALSAMKSNTNRLDKAGDKARKAYDFIFNNPQNVNAEISQLFNPRALIANLTGLTGETISKKFSVQAYDPEGYDLYTKLGNSKIQSAIRSRQGPMSLSTFKNLNKIDPLGSQAKATALRGERLTKAAKKAGKGVADINEAQKEVVKLLNKHYKKYPEELLGNTKLRNLLDLTLKDGEIVKKNKYVSDDDFKKLIKERNLFTTDHIDEVQFEKLSTEFPVFKQLATYNTNSGLIKSMKSYISKNQNSTDPEIQNKIKKQIAFLEDLKLRIDTPKGRVGSKEVLAAVDRKAGILPNFLAQLKALDIKIPSKAKLALYTIGGIGASTLAQAEEVSDTPAPFPGMLPEGSPGQINPEPEEIFDPERAEPGLAITAAAAPLATQKGRDLYGKFAKQIAKGSKNIGKALLKTVGSPLVASAFAASELSKEDPNLAMAGAELLLPDIAQKTLKETAKRKGILALAKRVALNPYFKLARGFTPLGATLIAAEGIKKLYDEEQKKNRMIEAMDPEEKLQFLEEEKATEEFMSRQSAAYGGRMGFADGPEDPKKRKFMKIMGGLASLPIIGRFIDIGTQAPKVAEVLRRGADGVPDFLNDLVTKVITFGKKSFSGGRSDELKEVYQLDNYVVTKKGDKTTIREVDQDGDMLYRENQMEIEIDPETGGVTYNEASARPDAEGKLKDVEEYIEESDLENMRKYTYDE